MHKSICRKCRAIEICTCEEREIDHFLGLRCVLTLALYHEGTE